MYMAEVYFETKFKKIFKKGDIVPNEIAELYLAKVRKEGEQELLIETPSVVEVEVSEDLTEAIKEKEQEIIDDKKELEEDLEDLENLKSGD